MPLDEDAIMGIDKPDLDKPTDLKTKIPRRLLIRLHAYKMVYGINYQELVTIALTERYGEDVPLHDPRVEEPVHE